MAFSKNHAIVTDRCGEPLINHHCIDRFFEADFSRMGLGLLVAWTCEKVKGCGRLMVICFNCLFTVGFFAHTVHLLCFPFFSTFVDSYDSS